MPQHPPRVLFVCLHGSAKSVIAAEHFRRIAAERGVRAEAESAGLEPDLEVPPHVVAGLLADGLDVELRRPRGLTRAQAEAATWIVSFAPDLSGDVIAGCAIEYWTDVPAVSDGYEAARHAIVGRVRALVDGVAGSGG